MHWKVAVSLALNAIVPDVQKTAKLVQEITAASIEQNSGANQINNAITQLNAVTQQNATVSEEMSSSAEELASQAEQLKELISFYKTEIEETIVSKARTMAEKQMKKPLANPQRPTATKPATSPLNLLQDNKKDINFESF